MIAQLKDKVKKQVNLKKLSKTFRAVKVPALETDESMGDIEYEDIKSNQDLDSVRNSEDDESSANNNNRRKSVLSKSGKKGDKTVAKSLM